MKKIALGVVFAFAGSAYAYDLGVPLNFAGPYDVVAPALYGDPSGADRVVGQVYYDVTTSKFKGINKNGTIDTLSSSAGTSVISGGTEKVERAKVTVSGGTPSIQSGNQSGSWVSSVTDGSGGVTTGYYILNITTGTFSSAPACVVSCVRSGSSSNFCGAQLNASPSTTTVEIIAYDNNADPQSLDDYEVNVICMGPQ